MKRSRKIRLILLGGLSAGALTACAPEADKEPRISADSVYTNDYYVLGAGYYHAPFHAFYARPYNYYDPDRKEYFYGGQWGAVPYRSTVNISAPSAESANEAEQAREVVERGGFGSTGSSYHIWS